MSELVSPKVIRNHAHFMESSDPDHSMKWKESLLRSGLPLEYCVSEILDRKGLNIRGEYIYARIDEAGFEKDHSVDIRATYEYHARKHGLKDCSVTFLLECKYSNPATKWLFLTHAANASFTPGLIESLDLLCPYRLWTKNPIHDIENNWDYCLKGTSLNPSESNSQRIDRGLSQLRWALPHLVADLLTHQAYPSSDEDVVPQFICPILVTNAPLFVINEGLALSDFLAAKEFSKVATQVQGVICYQEPGPQLSAFIDKKMIGLYESNRFVRERVEGIRKITEFKIGEGIGPKLYYQISYQSLTNSVLVLNLGVLDQQIDKIIEAVRKTAAKRYQVAHLEHVPGSMESKVVAPVFDGSDKH